MRRLLPPVTGNVLEYRAVHFDDSGVSLPGFHLRREVRMRKPATRVHLMRRGEFLRL
jgi:hypothetical protein